VEEEEDLPQLQREKRETLGLERMRLKKRSTPVAGRSNGGMKKRGRTKIAKGRSILAPKCREKEGKKLEGPSCSETEKKSRLQVSDFQIGSGR